MEELYGSDYDGPMSSPEQPTCVSIGLCDDVYESREGQKTALVGLFSRIGVKSLPALHPSMWVFFSVTNCRGTRQLSLSIENAATGLALMEVAGPWTLDDPAAIADVQIPVKGLVFSESGKHWVVLKSDGKINGQRPFYVDIMNESGSSEIPPST